ncbi:hypothetical protein GRX03_12315 [Halovenus sp. WSH3]|uniref:Uncharacterized protein n=1 Tax=Halovenus carboxidivorans TaxID=2692199 RepID=A0A6B0T2V5_9EURY|nr:hypothetical protein [Halovenus carboxidivorans]MXR52384.1 hypothetical protein [Halovenus carboxidivorans]
MGRCVRPGSEVLLNTMSSFILLNRSQTEITGLDRDGIRSELRKISEDTDIEFEGSSLTGTSSTEGFDLKYKWRIDKEDVYVLTEECYVDRKWYYLVLASVLGFAAAFTLFSVGAVITPGGLLNFAKMDSIGFAATMSGLGIFLISVMIYLIANSVPASIESLLPELRKKSDPLTRDSQYFTQRIIVFLASVLGSLGYILKSFVLLISGALLCYFLLYWLLFAEDKFDGSMGRFNEVGRSVVDCFLGAVGLRNNESRKLDFVIPVLTGEYLIAVITAVVIPGFFLAFSVYFGFFGVMLAGVGILLLTQSYLERFSKNISGNRVVEAIRNIQQDHRVETDKKPRAFWFILVILGSYLMLALVLSIFYFYQKLLFNPFEMPLLAIIAFYATTPILYFAVGLMYQTVTWAKEKISLFRAASPVEYDFDTSAKVYQIGDVKDSPAALSTGFNDYIFIPSKFIESDHFGKRELEAIVAHEEKHIQAREGVLFFYLPFLSILLFTGQNVLYALLNFREREFQADQYAKEKVGEDEIVSALNKAKMIGKSGGSGNDGPTRWQEHFGLFFGSFAHSQAHPGIDERKSRLRGGGE